jgi:hypothetical protein
MNSKADSAQESGFFAVSWSMKSKRRLLPLGIKDPIKTELPALIALEAIGKPWFNETHLTDLVAIALVADVLATKGSYIHMIAGELVAALQVPEMDIDVIRPLVIDISAWLQVQDNGRIDTAIASLLKQPPPRA